MLDMVLLTAVLFQQASACSKLPSVHQPAFLPAVEGSTALLPCHVFPGNTNPERIHFQWWYRNKNKKINVYPDDLSSLNHTGRVSLYPSGDQYSLTIAIARVQTTDQLSYTCSFSFILNGSYHILHGNGTKLYVHGPLEVTESCFRLNINLTCQVLVPDTDTSDSGDVTMLGWRGALSNDDLPAYQSQLMMKNRRILLRSQISVAIAHSQGIYTCSLQRGPDLLAQKSIRVVTEANPVLIYAANLIISFLILLVLVVIVVLQRRFSCRRRR
ncbi:uncharacterized protein LOC108919167 [Scleropages formosus]|uniref:uncharacterized protein LOC108919167 n=1 Tax=Scleropages formosus TaxID=113540 RepID=UPI000878BC10|nr:uncharacterized protein LOC108919167 [Scleropages formosus]XP_018582480.1 uncharacterized protein LOC108919167 [Scleropages formosus]